MFILRNTWDAWVDLFDGLPGGDNILPVAALIFAIWGLIWISRKWVNAG